MKWITLIAFTCVSLVGYAQNIQSEVDQQVQKMLLSFQTPDSGIRSALIKEVFTQDASVLGQNERTATYNPNDLTIAPPFVGKTLDIAFLDQEFVGQMIEVSCMVDVTDESKTDQNVNLKTIWLSAILCRLQDRWMCTNVYWTYTQQNETIQERIFWNETSP